MDPRLKIVQWYMFYFLETNNMEKVILISRNDGGVAVMHLADATINDIEVEINKFKELNPGDYASHRVFDKSCLPTERAFRHAWKDMGSENQIDFDMDKCRAIHMDRIRFMRNIKLSKLDIELMKAQELDRTSDADNIRTEKQRLRNIPQTFDLSEASTTEQLKELWPNDLEKHAIYK